MVPFLMRWVYHLQLLMVLASTVNLWSNSLSAHIHILLPRFETPGLVFITQILVAQLQPQALCFILVVSCGSQSYSEGVQTCLHWFSLCSLLYMYFCHAYICFLYRYLAANNLFWIQVLCHSTSTWL
jgi:hypothetical protein